MNNSPITPYKKIILGGCFACLMLSTSVFAQPEVKRSFTVKELEALGVETIKESMKYLKSDANAKVIYQGKSIHKGNAADVEQLFKRKLKKMLYV